MKVLLGSFLALTMIGSAFAQRVINSGSVDGLMAVGSRPGISRVPGAAPRGAFLHTPEGRVNPLLVRPFEPAKLLGIKDH